MRWFERYRHPLSEAERRQAEYDRTVKAKRRQGPICDARTKYWTSGQWWLHVTCVERPDHLDFHRAGNGYGWMDGKDEAKHMPWVAEWKAKFEREHGE